MSFDFHKFFNFKYLIDPNPGSDFQFFLPMMIVFVSMFVLGIIIPFFWKNKAKKIAVYKNLQGKWRTSLISFSIIGIFLLAFRRQDIPYLSSRILLFVLFFSIIYWLVSFLIYLRKDFRRGVNDWQEQENKMKYLRQGKKK